MSEINACPFCGRDGETFDWYPLGKPITQYGCGPCNFWTNNLDTWNRRAAPPTRPDVGDAREWPKLTDTMMREFYKAFTAAQEHRGDYESLSAGYKAMQDAAMLAPIAHAQPTGPK